MSSVAEAINDVFDIILGTKEETTKEVCLVLADEPQPVTPLSVE